jgi:histidinol-phosphate/aromatic aminotransferase/cobyric acid decarboxylase-like protein
MIDHDLRLHGDQLVREGLLDFAVNVWPASLPPPLRAALRRALKAAQGYPDPRAARQAVARRHGRSPAEVVPLNGACEAFWLIAHALRPRHAACVHPAFTEPEVALRATGTLVTRVARPPGDWRLEPEAVPADVDLVVVGNPNNPTGRLDPPGTVAALARPGRVLVVDESFIELTERPDHSLAGRRDLPGLVVVRSLTKLWGLAGLRAGYLLAAPELASSLDGHRQPWSVNGLALAALETCASDHTTPAVIARAVTNAREDLTARLTDLPEVRTWSSTANFVLIQLPRGAETVRRLSALGIAVRPAHSFPGLSADHLRLAVRHPADHARLARTLRTAMS